MIWNTGSTSSCVLWRCVPSGCLTVLAHTSLERTPSPAITGTLSNRFCTFKTTSGVMTSQSDDSKVFDELGGDVEHRIHEYLRIAEVCALQGVSKCWRTRVSEALRHKYRWDVIHVKGVDAGERQWLEQVAKAGVNVRSLRMVRDR